MPKFDLTNAVVYDEECLPNIFTLSAEAINSDVTATWEISQFRDDRGPLSDWLQHMARSQTPMIGFNNLGYDYVLLHQFMLNPFMTFSELFNFSQTLINQPFNQPRRQIYENDRFIPQIDLFKINHFDSKSKSTSLKALQINMRSEVVRESKLSFDKPVSYHDVDGELIPYNKHDTKETKKFAIGCWKAIEFRNELAETMRGDIMNFSDAKIGEKILEDKLGEELCFERSSGRRVPRQTPRNRIPLSNIIMPYIYFNEPQFKHVLEWMKAQTLSPADLTDPDASIETKGVFAGVTAHVGGIEFAFGTGGIHGSVLSRRFEADDQTQIRDIDVKGLYPAFTIVNRLSPAHLGERFVIEYAKLPEERTRLQKIYGKKGVRPNSMKLAANASYGKSNSKFSFLFDPQLTMTITINCQLLLCMLAEWLMTVPTFQIIQINTDGITYRIHRDYEPQAAQVCKQWEAYTLLELEDANYSKVWIRDVNSYIAQSTDGSLKQKGAYWHPDPDRYFDSISETQPPAWHKDLGNVASIKAAVHAMVHGIPPEFYIAAHRDKFDFMCRVKVDRASNLYLGGIEQQRTTRYYVARNGAQMVKVSPPPKGAAIGAFKRRPGVSDAVYRDVLSRLAPGEWSPVIHTKSRTMYKNVETHIEAGWPIAECNVASEFDFGNVNRAWYVAEAKKLIV